VEPHPVIEAAQQAKTTQTEEVRTARPRRWGGTVLERKTTLMLVGRILPLKISTEVKTTKETMTIHDI
jgi:hypothetical protein